MDIASSDQGQRRLAYLDKIVPYLFALGCARAWVTLTIAAPSAMPAVGFDLHNVFDYAYCALALVIALIVRRIVPLNERPWGRIGACAGMLGASACTIAASMLPEYSGVLTSIGAIVGGCGFSLFLLLWAETLGALSLVRIFLYTAASQLVAVGFVFFCQGLDPLRMNIAILLLPPVAVGSVVYAYRKLPQADKPKRTYPRFSYPWKLFVLFALYSFAYGLREQQLAAGAGMHSSLSTALVMGLLFASAYFFSDRFSIRALYRSPLLLMVCGFLLIPAESLFGTAASGYLIAMSYSLMSVLISLLLYDISKRLGIAIIALASVKSVEQLFVIGGKSASSLLASAPLPVATQDLLVTGIVAALILAATLILFSERELSSKWGVSILDSNTLIERSREEEAIQTRCDELSKRYRLSPREDEILRLLAQSKTGPAIERELFIAEGTVKAHTRHIYEKMGINSRKELRSLLGLGEN